MYLLFTKSKFWFSDLICKVTEEPVSHVSIYDSTEEVVYHSTFTGVTRVPATTFFEQQEKIIYYPADIDPEQLYKKFDRYKRSCYDIGALLFLGLCFMVRRYLRIPLPKQNLWQATGMFLCTEWVSQVLLDRELSMITPWKLYQKLLFQGVTRDELSTNH